MGVFKSALFHRIVVATLVLMACSSHSLEAQSVSIYSTIVGTVADTSGASVQDAKVTATNISTNISLSVSTDSQGLYRIDRLVLGTYTLSVEKAGYRPVVDQQITLASAQTARLNFALHVGAVTETVTANSDTSVLNSENGQISNTFDWSSRKYLPTSAPSFYDLTALQPATATSSPTFMVSFAGSLQNQYDYQVDGQSFRGSFGGHGVQGNYNEWMQQQSTGYVDNGAEYQSLAVANVTSKSGSNGFHASAVDYYSSGGLQGQSPFSTTRPSLVQNVYAGSVSGPIRKNRTFFYAAFSGTLSPGESAETATVPTQAMTIGNFAAFSPIVNPATGVPFFNNQIPSSQISSVSSTFIQKFYPAPNYGNGDFAAGNYRFTMPTFTKEKNLFARVDHHFSDRHSMFVHYEIDDSPCGVGVCFTGSLPSVGYRLGYRRDQNAVISDLFAFSPLAFNEFSAGWTRDLNFIRGQIYGASLVQALGLQGVSSLPLEGIPAMNIQGLTTVSQQSYYKTPNELYTIRDNVSWTHGKHAMKFGFTAAQGRDYELPDQPDPVFGSFSFTTALAGGTGNAFANFLLGIPSTENRQISFNPVYYRRNTYQIFVQDNIEASRKLTLNVGLRYEFYQPFQEIHGQAYTVNMQTGNIIVPSEQSLQFINPLILQNPSFKVQTATEAGYPSSIYSLSKMNFAPRLGLAYRLRDTTVVRGGYGIFYDFIPPQPTATDLFIGSESFPNNQIVNHAPNYQFPNPYAISPSPTGTLSVTSYAPHLRMPYTQQWNLTLEQQLGTATAVRASYIGSHSVEQLYSLPANIPLPSTTAFTQSLRPLTQFNQITQYQSAATSSYNALSLQLQYRTNSGIYVNTSYTWARDLGIAGETSASEAPAATNPQDSHYDYGPVLFSPTHQSVTVISYPFPIGKNRKFFSAMPNVSEAIFGGWNFSSIFNVRSGDHLTPTYTGYDAQGTGILTGRPDLIGNPNQGSNIHNVKQWFNPTAFAYPGASSSDPLTPPSRPIGRYGTAGVGIITGPGSWQEDMGLKKTIHVYERLTVNPFVLATNVFNHPSLGDPTTVIGEPGVTGTILSLRSDPNASGVGMRALQLGVRVEF